MYLKSPYPEPSALPEVNSHYLFFERPDQEQWPDYTLHIDVMTGQRRKYKEFVKRVEDLATTLGAPTFQGGLGLKAEDGEIIGIVSDNCMVRSKSDLNLRVQFPIILFALGLYHTCALVLEDHHSIHPHLLLFDPF
jgi:hypothetical protein